jgi:hypothetical protein
MSGRPYLSLFHRASSAHAILSSAGGGRAFGFGAAAELPGMVSSLQNGLRALSCTPKQFAPADPAAYAAFTADNIAAAFGKVLEGAGRRRVVTRTN